MLATNSVQCNKIRIIIGLVSLLFQTPSQFYYFCIQTLLKFLSPCFCYHPYISIFNSENFQFTCLLSFFAIAFEIMHLFVCACAQKSGLVNYFQSTYARTMYMYSCMLPKMSSTAYTSDAFSVLLLCIHLYCISCLRAFVTIPISPLRILFTRFFWYCICNNASLCVCACAQKVGW